MNSSPPKGRESWSGMRLEYFQLIDRIVSINLEAGTIEAEAVVPTSSTIFEGHFPGFPLMPGVLLLESMAQTSGWLIIGITKFARMPFLASFKEAKLRSFVTPGKTLSLSAKLEHEGSGFAVTSAQIKADGRTVANAEITFRLIEFPNPEFRASMERFAAVIGFPMEGRSDG
jgi:3-hydroxyacyl-[acyl-carrier-protein] dehydratase